MALEDLARRYPSAGTIVLGCGPNEDDVRSRNRTDAASSRTRSFCAGGGSREGCPKVAVADEARKDAEMYVLFQVEPPGDHRDPETMLPIRR